MGREGGGEQFGLTAWGGSRRVDGQNGAGQGRRGGAGRAGGGQVAAGAEGWRRTSWYIARVPVMPPLPARVSESFDSAKTGAATASEPKPAAACGVGLCDVARLAL